MPENSAWLLTTVLNGGNEFQILAFSGDEFHKKNRLNFIEWLNLLKGFNSTDKKYMFFGVTFSLKKGSK